MRMGGPQNGSARCGGEENLSPSRKSSPDCPVLQTVTAPLLIIRQLFQFRIRQTINFRISEVLPFRIRLAPLLKINNLETDAVRN
jgi:hypothetical protein